MAWPTKPALSLADLLFLSFTGSSKLAIGNLYPFSIIDKIKEIASIDFQNSLLALRVPLRIQVDYFPLQMFLVSRLALPDSCWHVVSEQGRCKEL